MKEQHAVATPVQGKPPARQALTKGYIIWLTPREALFLRDHTNAVAHEAVLSQGESALEAPRWHTALHEAGHAVLDALEGLSVAHTKVTKKYVAGKSVWDGFTRLKNARFHIDNTTSPETDTVLLRVLIAGFISEQLFLGNELRLASSADERGIAYIVSRRIAQKTGKDASTIHSEAWAYVTTVLKHNEAVVKAIARKLTFERVLRGEPLQKLLAKAEMPSKIEQCDFGNPIFLDVVAQPLGV